ncbi:MAG: efflux RND transporter periplasmic adaptor subunit [Phycisphaerae bacterium]|nr:MAG: HlyD family efflux transporter periplasmic adaptor subunit [Planctomycetota bacterium]KAB2948604.1 MAG: HlyD family efflux transporter periplasmic adaptor subunit [Phycisphaerae bacterium]MBE7456052.1 efflux RND transporter periplasmic adaptor subunit [Planctomycetia bacterium]MCK6466287.1 efflux RND transporter periplasmic adaptor subunit [Phycisphaerae bacterium]MCL4717310.1 efflux RND transporter periplasmic adaptor subunit [Phycisphaerae bacterium]
MMHQRKINPDNTQAFRRRAATGVNLAIGAVIGLAAVYGIWRLAAPAAKTVPSILTHTATRRSFTVSLQEKGELKAASSREVKCEVEGRSTVIFLLGEGTSVKEGDELVRLASNEIEDNVRQQQLQLTSAEAARDAAETDLIIQRQQNKSDIEQAKLKVDLAKLDLEKYRLGDWDVAQRDADIAIDQARMTLERAKEEFLASKDLFEKKYITATEYRQDEFEKRRAEWELEKAEKAKWLLFEYTHKMDIQTKESAVTEAESELERVEKNAEAEERAKVVALNSREQELQLIRNKLAQLTRQRDNCIIKAPSSGLVVYAATSSGRFMSNEDQVKEGATVYERQTLMTIVDTNRMNVLLRVHESKTSRVAVGQIARVQVEGVPGEVFEGSVIRIGTLAESQNRWINPDLKEYEVEIELNETGVPLKPGVTTIAEILVGHVEGVLAIPVQCVFGKGGKSFVFKVGDDGVQPAEVRTGVSNAQWIEIKDGLSDGDEVLLAAADEHLRLLPDVPVEQEAEWRGRNLSDGPIPGGTPSAAAPGMRTSGGDAAGSSPAAGRPAGAAPNAGRERPPGAGAPGGASPDGSGTERRGRPGGTAPGGTAPGGAASGATERPSSG